MPPKKDQGNESITALKGADRVRKRPSVIFGSDGLEGCEHAVFEIMSNSIDVGMILLVTNCNFYNLRHFARACVPWAAENWKTLNAFGVPAI